MKRELKKKLSTSLTLLGVVIMIVCSTIILTLYIFNPKKYELNKENINTLNTYQIDTIFNIQKTLPDSIAVTRVNQLFHDSIVQEDVTASIVVQSSNAKINNERFSSVENMNLKIAIYSLIASTIISFIGLIYQILTTQNTGEAVSRDNQKFILKEMFIQAFYNTIRLLSLYEKMKESTPNDKPYTQCPHDMQYLQMKFPTILIDLKVPLDVEEGNLLSYLYGKLELYNEGFGVLQRHLADYRLNNEEKDKEIELIISKNAAIVCSILQYITIAWGKTMKKEYLQLLTNKLQLGLNSYKIQGLTPDSMPTANLINIDNLLANFIADTNINNEIPNTHVQELTQAIKDWWLLDQHSKHIDMLRIHEA